MNGSFYQNQIKKSAANTDRNFQKVYIDITGKKYENREKNYLKTNQ